MTPVSIAILFVGLWALLHLWLVPRIKSDWQARDLRGKMARAGLLAILEKLRDLAAVGAVVLGALVILVILATLLGGADVVWPMTLVGWLGSVQGTVKTFADGYGDAIGILGLIGAGIALWLTARQARRRVVNAWMARAAEEHAAVLDEPERIAAAAEDPEARPIVEQIDATFERLRHVAVDPPSPARAQLEAHLRDLLAALSVELARKDVDLLAAFDRPAAVEAEGMRPLWRRLLAVVSSKKLTEDLGLVQKPLGHVVTGLLVLSLIGWSAQPLADSMALTVNNLRMQLAAGEAQRQLDVALSERPPAPPSVKEKEEEGDDAPSSAAVQAATRAISRAIVHDLVRAPLLSDAADVARASPADEGEIVRNLLAEQAPTRSVEVEDAATQLRREAAASAGRRSADGPARLGRYVEQQVAPAVQRLHAEQPGRLQQLVARLEARYSAPIGAIDAQGTLTGEVLDRLFGALDAKPSNELGKQADKLAKAFGKKALQTWVDANIRTMLSDYLTGSARVAVRQAVVLQTNAESRDLIRLLREPADIWTPSPALAEETRMSSKVADAVLDAQLGLPDVERQALRAQLAGYDAVFPPADPVLEMPDLPGSGGSGGGGGGGGQARSSGGGGGGRYASFSVASRSSRARGVVIGRDLPGTLDVRDLRWRMTPAARAGAATRVTLELRVLDPATGRGAWRSAGGFDAGVLNQALRYAADRRVVATTIMAGDGRAIGRLTYLHPALQDTPLGCRIIESDRWVDTFTADPVARSRALASIDDTRNQAQRWVARISIAESIAGGAPFCTSPELDRALENPQGLAPARFSPAYSRLVSAFVAQQLSTPPGSNRFIQSASRCTSLAAAAAKACLCEPGRAGSLPARYWFPEDHTSQVRERVARLTPDLAWLRPSVDRLGHLDFWIHTTFSLRSSGRSNDDRTAAMDFTPADIAQLRAALQRRLPAHLLLQTQSRSYEEFMRPLEEFVLSQRLARAALDGGLGRDFPRQRLLELARATRRFVPKQPTLRWEAPGRGNEDKLTKLLRQADPAAAMRHQEYREDVMGRVKRRAPMCSVASL